MALKKPKTKAEFFECELVTWDKLNALVAGLPKSVLVQPGAAGDWSVKDVWAHLASWMKKGRSIMPMLLAGEKVPANIQSFNEEQYAKNRKLTLVAARRRLERERKQILVLLKKIPEEQLLNDEHVYTWASFTTYNHYDEHFPALTKFRRTVIRRLKRAK